MTSPIDRDYARRPELIGDLSHVQWMKRPTFSAINRIREQKHSEFKKPYREDDHVPMEHWADFPFPVFTFPPFPNFPGPIPTDPSSPWILHPGEEEEEGPGVGCPPTCICHPDNPETIVAGETAMLNVTACAPPNEMSVSIHEDNYFNIKCKPAFIRNSGAQWVFTVIAEADACGLCTLLISCSDGSSTVCYLRCTTGDWTSVGSVCKLSGSGTETDQGAQGGCVTRFHYELIEGMYKQTQYTCASCTCSSHGECGDPTCAAATCPGCNAADCATDYPNCIDQNHAAYIAEGNHCYTAAGRCNCVCWCVLSIEAFEWGCP